MKYKELTDEQKVELNKLKKKSKRPKECLMAMAILMLNDKINISFIIKHTLLSRDIIYRARQKYYKMGITSLDIKSKNNNRILNKAQLEETINTLQTKKPSDFDYNSEYWTTSILGQLLENKYNIQYKSKTSLYLIFKKSGFSYHKPGARYIKQDKDKVALFIEEQTPLFLKYLHDDNFEILSCDQAIVTSKTTFQKIWLPIGKYPKIDVSSKHNKVILNGFLNMKTGTEHTFLSKELNSDIIIEHLKKLLIIYPNKTIIIYLDNARWHHSNKVSEFLNNNSRILLTFFSSYSPELNPQENVWKSMRSKITHNRSITQLDTLAVEILDYLNNTKFNYKFSWINY